ncbi:MAG TPA: hypothetical protein VFR10_12715 [bacterium]|nr:hypothetical protein [bacterium]
MPSRHRALFSTLTVTLFLVSALPLFRALTQRNDIWWTPQPMALPFAEAQDRVQIFIRDQPLSALIESGQLQMMQNGSSPVIAPGDVRLRLNNWDRLRAERMPVLLVQAAACGALALLFLILVTGRLSFKGGNGEVASTSMPG